MVLEWRNKINYWWWFVKVHFKPGKMDGVSKASEKSVCPPIHVVLKEICMRVEGIERLEKKITEVADNFTGELGQIREKMANLMVERRKEFEVE